MQGRSNAQHLFGMHQIPTDHQIRILLDPTDPMGLRSLFFYLFNGLNEAGIIDAYRCVNQTILIAFDGMSIFVAGLPLPALFDPDPREWALVQYDFRDNCLNIINYLGLFAGSCGASRARVRLQS